MESDRLCVGAVLTAGFERMMLSLIRVCAPHSNIDIRMGLLAETEPDHTFSRTFAYD